MSFLTDVDQELKDILAGEWSEPATIVAGSTTINTTGIFDKTSLDVNSQGEAVVTNQPQIGLHIDYVDGVLGHELTEADNALITIRSVQYKLRKPPERDGTGFAVLKLKSKT